MSTSATTTTVHIPASSQGRGLMNSFLLAGIMGLIISFVLLFFGFKDHEARAMLGLLVGYSFWLSIGIGFLFLVMLFYVFDAGWSVIIRRQMEHGLAAFPWLALIFLPVLLVALLFSHNPAVGWLWLNESNTLYSGQSVGSDALFQKKIPFLNPVGFAVAYFIFFGIWVFLSQVFRKSSFAMDVKSNPRWVHRCRRWSAAGIILTGLTSTFAAIYWFKSLDYHWFSTMYGVWFFSACMRAALAAAVIICALSVAKGNLKGIYNPAHSYYLGCLALAFTVFWAYISFSQYFLIYNANIPEETFWYTLRELNPNGQKNSWWWVSMGLVFGYFLFPFIYLLWYKAKFGAKIFFISVWILVFHLLDLYWNIIPGKVPSHDGSHYEIRGFVPHLIDLTMFVGVGGICIWAFMRSASKVSPIPINDPRIQESIDHHE